MPKNITNGLNREYELFLNLLLCNISETYAALALMVFPSPENLTVNLSYDLTLESWVTDNQTGCPTSLKAGKSSIRLILYLGEIKIYV
jgi:hypothetical protein